MKNTKIMLNTAAMLALMVPAAFARQAATTDPTVHERKENQQDRIANGIQSGQLTTGETKNLESKSAAINAETRNMRAADNGKLTAADRAKLENQQNRLSNQIYTDKHNSSAQQFGNGAIGQRRENQQDRIANGVRSGQLTAGETARLENNQQGLNREVSGMRQANGGKLTGADKVAVNGQQNKLSHQIYNKKHNGRRQ